MKRQLLGVAATAVLAMCFATTAQFNAAEAKEKTLKYCSEGSPENFNPQINTTGTSFDAAQPVFNGLVEFEPGTTKVIPGLAEKWDIAEDGKTYTFHLRKNVKFHSNKSFKPTRDFNADDVIATFNRMWKQDDPYYKVSGGAYDYFNDMDMPDLLKSIDKVDDYTVKFVLNEANVTFLPDIAMNFAQIHSKEYMDAMMKAGTPEKVDQDPIGTGPFSFVVYQKDAQIRYKAFKDYWGGKPKIDNLVFLISTDPAVRKAKLETGECDIMSYPNATDIKSLQANPKLQVLQQPGLNIAYLAMNVEKKPFDDVRVRKAINMAIDKKALIDAIYQGQGEPAKNPIPPTIWAYDNDIQPYPYDPEKAKELLKEAGVTSIDSDLWAMPVQRPYNPDGKRMAEMMQADLAKIGVTTHIVSYEWGEYRKRMQNGDHQMAQFGWTGDNGDPDNFMFVLLGCDAARQGGQNVAKWCNKDFTDLLVKARVNSDIKQRKELYDKAQVIFHDEVPWVPIAHSVVSVPMSKKVTGFKVHPLGIMFFTHVDKID
ncbi:MAG: ABC transporter substrate-binding protein [Rhodospirillaceae bacterium]|nr:MAG: ABC transporter substrate-binding protein [Rhodospirillaceae bacterium]